LAVRQKPGANAADSERHDAPISEHAVPARRRIVDAPHALIALLQTEVADAGSGGMLTMPVPGTQAMTPVAAGDRLVSLDVLRGLALLGIG